MGYHRARLDLMQRSRRYIWVPLIAVIAVVAHTAADGSPSSAAHRSAFVAGRSTTLSKQASRPASGGPHGRWVAAWTGSPQPATPKVQYPAGFADATVRNVIYSSAAGGVVRVQFSNAFGQHPLLIRAATVGAVGPENSVTGSRPLRFGGRTEVVVRAGHTTFSDPVRLTVRPLEPLAVSVYLPRATGLPTDHATSREVSLVGAGNHVFARSAAPFPSRTFSWYFVSRLDVGRSPRYLGAVVAFGDSITDGVHSTVGANRRWPNDLARRLDARPGPILSVVDAGISGNRLLAHSRNGGVSRFRRDALDLPSVRAVIVLEGVNDIGATRNVTVQQMIDGYEQLIRQAHAAGVKIFGATLTPFQGAGYWTPRGELKRDRINAWIRHSQAFDGVVDFAAAVADPGHPDRFRPAYDSGDHLHPDNTGYRTMANAINLTMLLRAVRR